MRWILLEIEAGGARKFVLGMIHLPPLPGTPFYRKDDFAAVRDTAIYSARALRDGGADGCLVQTVDRVYPSDDRCDPARVAALSVIVRAIADATSPRFHIGVHILRNALSASLAVAKVAGGSFVRAGALVGRTLSPSGLIEADPLAIMEYRNKLDAWDIDVIAEIYSMHYRWYGEQKPIGDVARAAALAGASAVCLCDPDEAVTLNLIAEVRRVEPTLSIVLGGYTNHTNVQRLLAAADGAFVGRCLEARGWGGTIDVNRVRDYVNRVADIGR